MPSKKHRHHLLYRMVHLAVDHPSRLLEGVLAVYLGAFFALTLWSLGGYLEYGHYQQTMLWGSIIALFLHGLAVMLRKEPSPFFWPILLPLPFLVWASISQIMFTPVPWTGGQTLMLWWQGYAFAWMVTQGLRTREHLFTFLWVSMIGVVAVLGSAFFQFYFFPQWNPLATYEALSMYQGVAAGKAGHPYVLTAVLFPFFAFTAYLALTHRFVGQLRLLFAFIALASLLGMFVSADGAILPLLGIVFLLLAVMAKATWKGRLVVFSLMTLVLSLISGLIWLTSDLYTVKPRADALFSGEANLDRADLDGVAYAMMDDAMVTGKGIGSFSSLYESYRESFNPRIFSPDYASAVPQLFAELGMPGIGLLAFLVLIFAVRGMQVWLHLPYAKVNKDADFRTLPIKEDAKRTVVAPIESDSPHRRRKKRRKARKAALALPMPATKVLLGAAWLMGFACALSAWIYPTAYIPALMLLSVTAMAVLIRYMVSAPITLPKSISVRVVLGSIPVMAAAAMWFTGAPTATVQKHVHEGVVLLRKALYDTDSVFDDASYIDAANAFSAALEIMPDNAKAQAGRAHAILSAWRVDPFTYEDLLPEALRLARNAVRSQSRNWYHQLVLAEALEANEGVSPATDQAFIKAMELAPFNGAPAVAYARYLDNVPHSRSQALALLEDVLRLQPEHPDALRLHARISLR